MSDLKPENILLDEYGTLPFRPDPRLVLLFRSQPAPPTSACARPCPRVLFCRKHQARRLWPRHDRVARRAAHRAQPPVRLPALHRPRNRRQPHLRRRRHRHVVLRHHPLRPPRREYVARLTARHRDPCLGQHPSHARAGIPAQTRRGTSRRSPTPGSSRTPRASSSRPGAASRTTCSVRRTRGTDTGLRTRGGVGPSKGRGGAEQGAGRGRARGGAGPS